MEPSAAEPKAQSTKEPYSRPELVTIELQAEQVLSAGCKSAGATTNSGDFSCGISAGCNTSGS